MRLEDMMKRGPIPVHMVANRVCDRIPEGWELCVRMENGAGSVELVDPEGNVVEFDTCDKSIDEQIDEALCIACGASDIAGSDISNK